LFSVIPLRHYDHLWLHFSECRVSSTLSSSSSSSSSLSLSSLLLFRLRRLRAVKPRPGVTVRRANVRVFRRGSAQSFVVGATPASSSHHQRTVNWLQTQARLRYWHVTLQDGAIGLMICWCVLT